MVEVEHRCPTRLLTCGLATIGTLLMTACDSTVGIPQDDTGPVAIASVAPSTSTSTAAKTPTLLPDAPPVGSVPGQPATAPAVQRWAIDVAAADRSTLTQTCWQLPPAMLDDLSANSAAVLAALAQPGTHTEGGATWTDGTTTIFVRQDAIESGYACGRVSTSGTPEYTPADARHTVRRYLSRQLGAPVHPDDQESTHPLACSAELPWDPTGTGTSSTAPWASTGPAALDLVAFTDEDISSQGLRSDYLTVSVPTIDSAGGQKLWEFTLTQTPDGYCIGEASDTIA